MRISQLFKKMVLGKLDMPKNQTGLLSHHAKIIIIIIIKQSSQRNLPSRLGRRDTEELASCGFSVLGQEKAAWRGTGVGCGQILQRGGAMEISDSERGRGFLRSQEGTGVSCRRNASHNES